MLQWRGVELEPSGSGSDFETCETEGETRENLFSAWGPCARDLWMRLNCRRTCGTCGLGLRETISLKPMAALKAARAAALQRNSPALHKFAEEESNKQRKAKARQQRRRDGSVAPTAKKKGLRARAQ